MKFTILLLVFISIQLNDISGQKFLIIERTGTPRTKRFGVYEDITFQLKDDSKGWYKRQILDMNPDGQMLLLGDSWISIADMYRIRLSKERVLVSILGGALQGGGISMMLGDAWYTVRGNPEYTQGGLEFGLLNIGVGSAIRALFGPIKYKLGKKTRLKVIDVTFGTVKS